jgi:hypothetical protein
MASLKGFIEELDLINSRLELMSKLLAELKKGFDDLPDVPRSRTPHEADKPHTCPSCDGEGYRAVTKHIRATCEACNGSGQV